MSKLFSKLLSILTSLLLLIYSFVPVNTVYADTTSCGDKSLGITYDPTHFIFGSGSMSINFHLTNPTTWDNIKNVRLRFGQTLGGALADIYVPRDGMPVSAHDFSITVSGVDDRILGQIKDHPGELQWRKNTTDSFQGFSCPITYYVDPVPKTVCQFDPKLEKDQQPNSPITIQFGGNKNTTYYLFLLKPGGPLSSPFVKSATTDDKLSGAFDNIILNGNQGDQIKMWIDFQSDSEKLSGAACEKDITLTIAASAQPAECYWEPISPAPNERWGVRAVNLKPSTSVYAELDDSSRISTVSPSAATVIFDLPPGTKPSEGNHVAKVIYFSSASDPTLIGQEACPTIKFHIDPDGNTIGGPKPPAGPVPIPPPGITIECKPGDKDCTSGGGIPCDLSNKANPGILTAIGCIHTSPAAFVKDFLTFAIGISGGLAFLMMILGAFQMLTSAGNPDTLRAGRERLTNAIIGLLIVIFAVLLLQITGADILNIPGFGR